MEAYAPLAHHELAPGTRFADHSPGVANVALPDLVLLEDPATWVMTDFLRVHVVTTTPAQTIDQALECMKQRGVRLLLVVDGERRVVGVITSRDIEGERPLQLVQQTGVPRAELSVEMVMTPQSAIEVLDYARVRSARVGDVVATLHALERQHALVAEDDPDGGGQTLRGLFSTTQVGRQLGRDLGEEMRSAHSLAEIVHGMG